MIAPEEIVPTLESILADEAVFMSKLESMEPHSMTPAEVKDLGEEITPTFEIMAEMVKAIVATKPDPKVIGDKFKRAFENVGLILELQTKLIRKPAN